MTNKYRHRFDWSLADALWGKCTDREIARVVGCTAPTVMHHRKVHGIDPCFKKMVAHEAPVDLGQLPDKIIAEREGVSEATVVSWRRNRGIPSFRATEERKLRETGKASGQRNAPRYWNEERSLAIFGTKHKKLRDTVGLASDDVADRINALLLQKNTMRDEHGIPFGRWTKHGLAMEALRIGLDVLEAEASDDETTRNEVGRIRRLLERISANKPPST